MSKGIDKDLFYRQMQPYFEQGLVREVYSSDDVCILAFGELCYVACPYILANNQPFGIYTNHNFMKKLVDKNRLIYPLVEEVCHDVNAMERLVYNFPIEKIDFWKKWIEDFNIKGISEIDHQLEEQIGKCK